MRIERKVWAAAAVLGSLLLAASGSVPALARSGPSNGLRFGGLRFADTANATSTSWGGWSFKAKAAKSATTEYKVPALKCTAVTSGVGPIAVIETGTNTPQNFDAAGLTMKCKGGKAVLNAVVLVDDKGTVGVKPPAAGDLIQATVTSSTSKTTATVKDLTKGHTFTVTRSGKGAASLQELIIDDSLVAAADRQIPLANFGKMAFTSAAVSGTAIGTVTPRTALNMQTTKKVLQILAGPITGAKKSTFTNTWKHS